MNTKFKNQGAERERRKNESVLKFSALFQNANNEKYKTDIKKIFKILHAKIKLILVKKKHVKK